MAQDLSPTIEQQAPACPSSSAPPSSTTPCGGLNAFRAPPASNAPPASPTSAGAHLSPGLMAPVMTGGQSGSHAQGLSEETHALAGMGTPQGAQAQGPPATPALCCPCCLGDLILGPEARSWARLLVLDHLDGDSRLALHRTCTAARDLMLVTAETASVRLEASVPFHMARLRSIRSGLQSRGKLRTKLVLEACNSNLTMFALGMLEAGTTWLHELELGVTGVEEATHNDVLAAADRCCPNLKALDLGKKLHALPSADLFPKLQELCIRSDDSEEAGPLFLAAVPYIEQLTDLQLYPRRFGTQVLAPAPLPSLLFTPGTIATHLTTLHLPVTLHNTLLDVLLEGAPALEVLHVSKICIRTDRHTQARVRWRELHTHVLVLSSLARLPVAPDMQVRFKPEARDPAEPSKRYGHPTVLCDIVGGGKAVAAAHLRKVCMDSHRMAIAPGDDASAEEQPAALRVAMDLLHTWHRGETSACPYVFELLEWTMSPQLVHELHRLPRFHRLMIDYAVWLPGPLLYSTLLQVVPDSYHTILIDPNGGLTKEQLERICLASPAGRKVKLQIQVLGRPEQVLAIQHKVQQGGNPDLTVTDWEE